jgi:hypothetical protein
MMLKMSREKKNEKIVKSREKQRCGVDCGLQDARFHVNSRVFSEVQKKK